MRRPLSLLALACAVAACTPDASPPDGTDAAPAAPPAAPAGESGSRPVATTRLTVYSGEYESLAGSSGSGQGVPGHALVDRPLHYTLKTGQNSISATGIPASMDVEAAVLRTSTPGVTVDAQRYVAPLADAGGVAGQVIGQRIAVEHTSGNAKQTDTGTLLAAGDGLTLALNDGRIKVIRAYDSFSVVDGARLLPQQAELRWTVSAARDGDAEFNLSYPMGGLAWRAEYTANLAPGEDCRLELDGAALVANRSGVGFAEALLTLVAGEPRRAQVQAKHYASRAAAAPAMDSAMPVQRRSGEYHAYELPQPIRIGSGTTERVALFPRQPAVACERAYVVDSGVPGWQPPRPLIAPDSLSATGRLPVTAAVSFDNSAESNLGRALPAGRVRVLEGRDLVGESTLPHTAVGEEVRLVVGTAFDLVAEREATAFRIDRAGRSMSESFTVTVSNARDTDATVRVIEPLPRWSEWEIVNSSVEVADQRPRQVEFELAVPAGGEAVLDYTVRYRWPEGVAP